jgi:DNA modification methylase/uncharacterized ParB-like nuclease family protein
MKHSINNQSVNLKININNVEVSDLTKNLYDYSNRSSEISSLEESISLIGQQQPITVIKNGPKYLIIDGVLRFEAMKRLSLNEIDSIVNEFTETNEFSLSDLIIHQQISKQKSGKEKLNEIRTLLRVESTDANPLRDKEKRVLLVSSLLGGKGWGRNNVYSLDKILRWELKTNSELRLAEKVISNEITVRKAIDTIDLIENSHFEEEKEKESRIVDRFIKGAYTAEKAQKLMDTFNKKKSEGHTIIELYPENRKNYTVIQGNIEEVELPEDLQIDTIFTSPPYYKIVKYGDDPNELGWEATPDLYVKRLATILMKGYDKLKNTGSMFINLGESYEKNSCLAVTDRLTIELISRGVNFVDRLIWNKIANKPASNKVKRLLPGYETILHFSKSKDYYFDRVRIQSDKKLQVSRGCKEKGGGKISYHIPNNYDQFRNVLSDDTVSTVLTVQLNINRTKHIEGEAYHPATFSSNLPVIPLLMSTPKDRNSVVFDPFLGSGSCGVTSLQLGFKFWGVELYKENIATAERILFDSQQAFDEDALNALFAEDLPMDESYGLDELKPAA